MHVHESILIRLDHTHVATGEIRQQHTEGNRDEQQRLILLLDTQVEQHERNRIHDQELRFSKDIAERSHLV